MHIPDGLLGPRTYLTAYALALPWWAWCVRRVAAELDIAAVPRLAVLTAMTFILTTVMIPLPGGTSAHVTGVALLALVFGLPTAALAHSLVLALQALLFGTGGITTLPVNALAMGMLGGAVTLGIRRAIAPLHGPTAIMVATWCAVVAAALAVATILGLQPQLARSADGEPLFFPFGLSVTVPAVVGPHLLIGAGEAVLTWLVLGRLQHARSPGHA